MTSAAVPEREMCIPSGVRLRNPDVPNITLLLTNNIKDVYASQSSHGGTEGEVIVPIYFGDVFNFEVNKQYDSTINHEVVEWFKNFPGHSDATFKKAKHLPLRDMFLPWTPREQLVFCGINFVFLYALDDLHENVMGNSNVQLKAFCKRFFEHIEVAVDLNSSRRDEFLAAEKRESDFEQFKKGFPEESATAILLLTTLDAVLELGEKVLGPVAFPIYMKVYYKMFSTAKDEAVAWRRCESENSFPSWTEYSKLKYYLNGFINSALGLLSSDDYLNIPDHESTFWSAASLCLTLENDLFSYPSELEKYCKYVNPFNVIFAKVRRDGQELEEAFLDVALMRSELIKAFEVMYEFDVCDSRRAALKKVMQHSAGLLRFHFHFNQRYGWQRVL